MTTIRPLAERAHAASLALATVPTATKNAVLHTLAERLKAAAPALQAANAQDLAAGRANGLAAAMLDRLELTETRIAKMADGVRQVAALPDPLGAVLHEHTHPKGFRLQKVRVPIGVIGIVYESRPNVTVDCAALCFKSGNAAILRGGKEAFHSNTALAVLIAESLTAHGLDPACVELIPTTDRAALGELLQLDDLVHCLIPRGGEGLIRYVAEHARMPVIKHFTGVCNGYLDAAADPAMAVDLVVNAKAQRVGICNALENLLVHRDALATLWPAVAQGLAEAGVELRVDAEAKAALDGRALPTVDATEADWETEYLDHILSVKTVSGFEEAVAFINRYGSRHTDMIVTEDAATAERFLNTVDTASAFWNVSTRFADGFEYDLGAEIGISTDKLHARGPMGLEELTSYKWVARGRGETRR